MFRIHHLQLLDVGQGQLRYPSARFAEHRLRKIDTDYAILRRITGERDARADTDLENSPADPFGCGGRCTTPALEYSAKDQIVDGRPERICLQ